MIIRSHHRWGWCLGLHVVQVFTEYFKELEEESIQDNFVVVYELLDELMDFGFPQTTDSKILQEWDTHGRTHRHKSNINIMCIDKECGVWITAGHLFPSRLVSHRYITQEGAKLEVAKSKVPTTVTNAVSWRSEGIKYKKNEVFIDVIESINVLVRWDIGLIYWSPIFVLLITIYNS